MVKGDSQAEINRPLKVSWNVDAGPPPCNIPGVCVHHPGEFCIAESARQPG